MLAAIKILPNYSVIRMNIPLNSQNQQVTAVISHYIRPGRLSGYEAWLEGISQVARQFEGHNGAISYRIGSSGFAS